MSKKIPDTFKLKFYNTETRTYYETIYRSTERKYRIEDAFATARLMVSRVDTLKGSSIMGVAPSDTEPTYPELSVYEC